MPRECGTLFAVYKSEDKDRIVFNGIPQNMLEAHLPGFAKLLPSGADFADLILDPGDKIRIFSDDLSDCLPSFMA